MSRELRKLYYGKLLYGYKMYSNEVRCLPRLCRIVPLEIVMFVMKSFYFEIVLSKPTLNGKF